MPGGIVHERITLLSTAAATTAAVFISPDYAVAVMAGGLAGVFLTPDLDVDNGNLSHGRVRQWFGQVAGELWRLYWLPYAKLMGHRGFWSHFPVVSTAIRWLLVPLTWALFKFPWLWPWVLAMFIGNVVTDIMHFLADKLDEALGGRL